MQYHTCSYIYSMCNICPHKWCEQRIHCIYNIVQTLIYSMWNKIYAIYMLKYAQYIGPFCQELGLFTYRHRVLFQRWACSHVLPLHSDIPVWMGHGTRANESRHTYEWVTTHVWMSHVKHMNESRYTWMSHVTRMNESRHTWMSHVTRMNESRRSYERGMSHICMSQCTRRLSHMHMRTHRLIHMRDMTHSYVSV